MFDELYTSLTIKPPIWPWSKPNYRVRCLCANQNYLFSSHLDGKIRVWDLRQDKFKLIKTSQNYNNILSLCLNSNYLFIGSADGKIRVWDLRQDKFKLIKTLKLEVKSFCSLVANQDHLFSGGIVLSIWDLNKDFKFVKTIKNFPGIIVSICLNQNFLCHGGNGGEIHILDVNTFETIKTIDNLFKIKKICVNQDYLICANSEIKIWSLKDPNFSLVKKINYRVNQLCPNQDYLFFSGKNRNGGMKVCDLNHNFKLFKILGPKINFRGSICINDKYLFVGSKDKTIQLWHDSVKYNLKREINLIREVHAKIPTHGLLEIIFRCFLLEEAIFHLHSKTNFV